MKCSHFSRMESIGNVTLTKKDVGVRVVVGQIIKIESVILTAFLILKQFAVASRHFLVNQKQIFKLLFTFILLSQHSN